MREVLAPPAAPPGGPTLRDIHLPPAPSWWPPAPGWWMLGGLTLLLLGLSLWIWRRRRRARAWRVRILREVDQLAEQHRRDGDLATLAAGLQQLLRRVARQYDSSAIRQTGSAWRRTLSRVSLSAPALERLVALDELIYRDSPAFDHVAVVADVRSWLQRALKPSAWKAPITEQDDA